MGKILLVKLAAIGDVTVLSAALARLPRGALANTELHWIIDPALEPLADAFMKRAGIKVRFHGYPASALMGSGAGGAARGARSLAALARSVAPDLTLVFHRDWRYRLLLRLAQGNPVLGLGGGRRSEYAASQDLLARAGLGAHSAEAPFGKIDAAPPPWRVGILAGGARNAKVSFEEKKWPHLRTFVLDLLADGRFHVELFGGPDDAEEARAIAEGAASEGVSERLRNQVGRLPLGALPDALAALDVFVGIDSGLSHIAAQSMRPGSHVFTLFGPTSPLVWAPSPVRGVSLHVLRTELGCSPCYLDDGRFNPCPFPGDAHRACMKSIASDEARAAVLRALEAPLQPGP